METKAAFGKKDSVLKSFSALWEGLFITPVHLDSSLSKQPPKIKTILAKILPEILLRPTSLAESLGVGVPQGEPWCLDRLQLSKWRPAHLMAERMYELMIQRGVEAQPTSDDFPSVMINDWESKWGKEVTQNLIATLGLAAPLSLRANRRVGAQGLLSELTAGSRLPVKAELSNLSPQAVRLAEYAPVLGTESYEKGGFEIQDEGSQLMAFFALWPDRYGAILSEKPGPVLLESPAPPLPKETPSWEVVDACAGAGGKSLAIADAMKGKGRVYAYDISLPKLLALRRRAKRAGLNSIQTVQVQEGNESETLARFSGSADIVLVDAPCSGWGVLRRNPDIKWRQSPDVLERMPQIQLRLLGEYSRLVKKGGRLIYGVCTFREEETRKTVERFLELNPDFKAKEGGFLGPGPCDGFFMQMMVRDT